MQRVCRCWISTLLAVLLGGRIVVWWLALTGILLTVRWVMLSIARGGSTQLKL
jgi:hypothetical protein